LISYLKVAKNKKHSISIKNVAGSVVSSNNQSGGTTAHSVNNNVISNTVSSKKESFFSKWYVQLFGFFSAVLTILAYFGYQPRTSTHQPQRLNSKQNVVSLHKPVTKLAITSDTIKKKKVTSKKKNMFGKENKNPPINLGNIRGDVVISQNQTGGITAHTVNQYGKPIPEARHISSEDKNRLSTFDKNNLIIVVISMVDAEANNYGGELINYLKANGYNLQVDGYQMGIGSGNKRFDVNPPDNNSVRVFVPTQN
jgi:hypothetical protein